MQSADVLVVGAGPYGLSAAAQLRGRGVRVAIVGKVMELWREHMPDGMLLRSQWWASNLSAPGGRHSLRAFLREIGQEPRLSAAARAVPRVHALVPGARGAGRGRDLRDAARP